MKTLIADQKLVSELLPMDKAVAVMREALTMLAGGDVVMPLRTMMQLPGGERVVGLMPSYLGGIGRLDYDAKLSVTDPPKFTPVPAAGLWVTTALVF